MFLANSRYAQVATVQTTTADGRSVVALKRRTPTPATGEPRTVVAGDRLDLIAHAEYGDATRFWQIADAHSALDSRTLVAVPGATLFVPKG